MIDERLTFVEALADACRAKGIAKVSVDGVSLELGPAPVVTKPASTMTAEQRAESERAAHRAAKVVRLRRQLGREPKDFEIDGPEALP